VAAPDVLVQANAYGVLSDSVWRADMGDGDVRAVAIDSPVGELTATYTSERLEGLDQSSAESGRWPTDEHGRPLQILYGIVTCHTPNGAVHALDLGEARRQAIAGFQRFLADEQRFTVDATRGFELRGVAVVCVQASAAAGVIAIATATATAGLSAVAQFDAALDRSRRGSRRRRGRGRGAVASPARPRDHAAAAPDRDGRGPAADGPRQLYETDGADSDDRRRSCDEAAIPLGAAAR